MIRPAWDLVVTGVRAGIICANQLGELLTCLRDNRGLTIREIDFDVVGERVDVSLLGSSCTTDRQELSWCLQALAQSVGAPPYERQQALYTRVVTERIEETTVGDLGSTQVGAANALDADYRLPDGRTVRGPTMALYPFGTDEKHRLGPGSQLTLDGVVWTVHAVELGHACNGWVELQAEVSADRSPAPPQTLDFLFECRCQRCGGRTGWDGGVDHASGRPVVSTRCIRCPEVELLTGGAVEAVWAASPPRFTVGRDPR